MLDLGRRKVRSELRRLCLLQLLRLDTLFVTMDMNLLKVECVEHDTRTRTNEGRYLDVMCMTFEHHDGIRRQRGAWL